MHADVWRRRLDATTNWAVVTTAAVITFTFGEAQAPHFVLLMAVLFALFFLVMESRRYQIYHMWELRIRGLQKYVISPALMGEEALDRETTDSGLAAIGRDLGSTLPRISLLRAAGYRMRRNYGPLFTIVLLAWLGKLWLMPVPTYELSELVERAAVGTISGGSVLLAAGFFFLGCILFAISAPSEHIIDWTEQAAPVRKFVRAGRTKGSQKRHGGGMSGSDLDPPEGPTTAV
jgi:uncharacterized membrane protein